MEACPNEIVSLIFPDACTDDGLTGPSLSLVSRHIHDTSRRYALQSVALHGSHQLSAFASLLNNANVEDRDVHHLYLSDRRKVWTEYFPGQDNCKERWLTERVAEYYHVNSPLRKCFSSAIWHILKVVAPTLRTLTLLLFDRYDEPSLSNAISLPKLRELTIHGSNITHTVQSELSQCLSLRRLHVIQDFPLIRPITQAVLHLAPLLTHVRISRFVPSPIGSGDIQDDLASGFPPTPKRVLVQMIQQRLRCATGAFPTLWRRPLAPSSLTSPMADQLRDVAMRDVRRRIVVLKPAMRNADEAPIGEDSDMQYYMAIKVAWKERAVGSESAVWEVEPSSILASYGYCTEAE
ncbi:hypothetical protein V8D89_004950 [Ganoderma adspersum]